MMRCVILGIIQVISGLSINILWSRFDAANKKWQITKNALDCLGFFDDVFRWC